MGIESRGLDATGVATINKKGNDYVEKADLPAKEFIQWRRGIDRNPKSILLHTRFSTKGTPLNNDNNHPIKYGNSIVIHNGHISNDDELFESENLDRIAHVDSEIIAALFDKYTLEKAHIPLQKLEGNCAVAVIDKRSPNSLVLAKGHSSPLSYVVCRNTIIWASSDMAIKEACKKVLDVNLEWSEMKRLSEGQILYVEDGKYDILDFVPLERKTVYKSNKNTFSFLGYNYSENKEIKTSRPATAPITTSFTSRSRPWKLNDSSPEWFINCDECFIPVEQESAIQINTKFYCEKCVYGADVISNIVEDNNMEETSDELNVEHYIVCELVAEKNEQSIGFVEWILFEASDEVLKDPYLNSQYDKLSVSYDKMYNELLDEEEEEEEEDKKSDDFSFTRDLMVREEAAVLEVPKPIRINRTFKDIVKDTKNRIVGL
jgi:hypothetical protein